MPLHAFYRSFFNFFLFATVFAHVVYFGRRACSAAVLDSFRFRHQTPLSLPAHDGVDPASSALRSDGLSLRHVIHHGAGQPGPRARRLDITSARIASQAYASAQLGPFAIKTLPIAIDRTPLQQYDDRAPMSPFWLTEEVPGPDMSDKQTILLFANMSEDAYKPDFHDPEWLDVGEVFNSSLPFGWEDSGIRGQVFSDDGNSTVVLSVKGTSVAMFEGNGTSGHDKDNDNLFGSCCCGQGGPYLWRKTCDCMTDTYTCDEKCVKEELKKPNRYFEATLELYDEVLKLYPTANIITTGHSLGGVLASLIALRHGLPSISFEAYPQAMAAARLGLQVAGQGMPLRRNTGTFHVGHTADPIYMGTCNGASSFCSIAGYAFESSCHTGKRCSYDVVKDWGWRQSTQTHRLRYSIDYVYSKYDRAPVCEDETVDCMDCYLWKFENGTHTKPSTTTTMSSTSRTRTETCKTPGWWGCRDEPTTTSAPTTTMTVTTTSTSTCKTPGWFGCNDKTTTPGESTTTSEATTTTTCTSKGWFGRCLDPTPITTSSSTGAAYAHRHFAPTPTPTLTLS